VSRPLGTFEIGDDPFQRSREYDAPRLVLFLEQQGLSDPAHQEGMLDQILEARRRVMAELSDSLSQSVCGVEQVRVEAVSDAV